MQHELSYERECLNPECNQNGFCEEILELQEIIELYKFCPYCGNAIRITKIYVQTVQNNNE